MGKKFLFLILVGIVVTSTYWGFDYLYIYRFGVPLNSERAKVGLPIVDKTCKGDRASKHFIHWNCNHNVPFHLGKEARIEGNKIIFERDTYVLSDSVVIKTEFFFQEKRWQIKKIKTLQHVIVSQEDISKAIFDEMIFNKNSFQ